LQFIFIANFFLQLKLSKLYNYNLRKRVHLIHDVDRDIDMFALSTWTPGMTTLSQGSEIV